MPLANKVQTQLLVSPIVRDKARALAIVRQEAAAEIYRIALEPALDRMISATPAVQELMETFALMGVDPSTAMQAMLEQKIRYADLFLPDGRPRARFPKPTSRS